MAALTKFLHIFLFVSLNCLFSLCTSCTLCTVYMGKQRTQATTFKSTFLENQEKKKVHIINPEMYLQEKRRLPVWIMTVIGALFVSPFRVYRLTEYVVPG